VLVNGQAEKSCEMDVSSAAGKNITTIEGLSADRSHPAQVAWIANQVPQCGWCQSGMLMSVASALNNGVRGASIANEINNVCVCGTYSRIKQAVSGL
jgi:isoquinoline 1-oxidoreductase alpha subunit